VEVDNVQDLLWWVGLNSVGVFETDVVTAYLVSAHRGYKLFVFKNGEFFEKYFLGKEHKRIFGEYMDKCGSTEIVPLSEIDRIERQENDAPYVVNN